MGRHADPRSARLPALPVLVAAALVVVLVGGGLVWWLAASGDPCERRQTVAVTVAPAIEPLAKKLLAEPQDLGGGACAVAAVRAQRPLQTVADLQALSASALPQVWVPDSSLWGVRATGVSIDSSGSVTSTPVVLATSRATAEGLGWTKTPPTWADVISAGRSIAAPDLAGSAEALSALVAVRRSFGNGVAADDAVVGAVLAASRGTEPSLTDALTAARDAGADAPLVPATEQEVLAANQGVERPTLVAVYPRDGSPWLDYPVLRIGDPSDAQRPAVDAVVRALTSRSAHAAARAAGFRGPDGAAPPGAGPASGTQESTPRVIRLEPGRVRELIHLLDSLSRPVRLLAVVDVSASMGESVGAGTRATLARDAAKSAMGLLPDDSALALWVFARALDGDRDWQQLVPMRTLGTDVDGRAQRDLLAEQLDTVPDRLVRGGTGLYDTALGAFRQAKRDHHPAYVSSVVIITDGKDDDPGSIGLDGLLATLKAEAEPARPVKIIGIALGPDADLNALQQIAAATGGSAYAAVDPKDLQSVLFDALRQRG
jgi:Mg-chelatase subunit ChlD